MMIYTSLFIILGVDLLSLVIISVILLFLGNIFKETTDSMNSNNEKDFNHQLLVDVIKINPMFGRICSVLGLIMLVLLPISIIFLYVDQWIPTLFIWSCIPLLISGMTILPVSFRYNHWSEYHYHSINRVTRKRFNWIIALRTARLLLIFLFFFLPALTLFMSQIILSN
ncbi:hypothetical protein [Lactiplantibacillus herbarum]|uniref:hypothetical protein n=1 Tax=Lactiplantibacillus herbarum TaxID=1670446 RepID=UPI00064E7D18|nr:hypothetical protein [Lactiplantibacillus herbarum]